MTTSTRPASAPKGKTTLAFVLGLTLGLVIAAAIAMFVTRAPVPFVDRGILSNQNTERQPTPAASTRVQPSLPEPLPEAAPALKPSSNNDQAKDDKPSTPAASQASSTPQEGTPEPRPTTSPSAASQFFLQVAAFKSPDEAEQMRVRLAFMGFEAHILETKKDDTIFFRVRLGPYRNFEELNRAKSGLSQNGLEATVVRLNP
jgi:cell division protein FtsN